VHQHASASSQRLPQEVQCAPEVSVISEAVGNQVNCAVKVIVQCSTGLEQEKVER
jgi:hypothetical protein